MYKAECKGSLLGTSNQLVLASVGLEESWIQILFPPSSDWDLIQTPTLWLQKSAFDSVVTESLFHSLLLEMCKVYFSCCASGRKGFWKFSFSINISTNMFSSQFWWKHIFYILMIKWSFSWSLRLWLLLLAFSKIRIHIVTTSWKVFNQNSGWRPI